jgi:hypothetical protein
MIKHGVVKEKETPSILSGIKSAKVKKGEALAVGEELDKSIEDLAPQLTAAKEEDVEK